jgi:uncharacterized protein (DUF488 family)
VYYRRKIILALLQSWGNRIEKIALQKLLFLFSEKQTEPAYEFVPYHYGCYSFSANADLNAMKRQSLVDEDRNSYTRLDKRNLVPSLTTVDRQILIQLKIEFGRMKSDALMKHVYQNHKYYAINSARARELLSVADYRSVRNSAPWSNKDALFTIGYEGISLEAYLNKLINNDVKVLCDVRRNPLSMKFGFSKEGLKRYCEALGIIYFHLPTLGIPSGLREDLTNQSDYDNLFSKYKQEILPNAEGDQQTIVDLLHKHSRVALTCFEAEICRCHRRPLADWILNRVAGPYELLHI